MNIFILLLLSIAIVSGSFLSDPEVKWTLDLSSKVDDGNAEVLRGNAVKVSSSENEMNRRIYVTTRDGRLHTVEQHPTTANGNDKQSSTTTKHRTQTHVYEPDPMPSYCASGVALYEKTESDDEDDQEALSLSPYAAYAVVNRDGSSPSSRVIAVGQQGWNNGNVLRWSVSIPGIVEGTPIVSKDGTRVYVVHNQLISRKNNNNFLGQQTTMGSVSIIEIVPDGKYKDSAQVIQTMSSDEYNYGYVALGQPTSKTSSDNDEVVLVVAASSGGPTGSGGLYAILPESQNWYRISNYPMPTRLKPALSSQENEYTNGCYLAHGSILTAWDGDQDISRVLEGDNTDIFPSWEEQMQFTRK